ncbi:MAG: LLM class flavin-dependent oxidoreductase [Mesorhizobium sp.]
MSIEFTHVPAFTQQRHENLDNSGARQTLALLEHAGFGRIVIDSPAGLLATMDVAAEAARRTSSLGLVLTHWAGVIAPVIAARQLAELDRLSEGRLSLRMLAGFDGAADDEPGSSKDHFVALQQMDEYLTLLKRLWSNDRPFDHEGRFYSVRNGYVARKGPQGGGIQIRMGGVSGTALKIAGRHADIFEVAAGTPEDIIDLVYRLRVAATQYGRASKIRFALPVRIDATEQETSARDAVAEPDGAHSGVRVSGSPEQIAESLLTYVTLGINEFMISGLDDDVSIAGFLHQLAPISQGRRIAGKALGGIAPSAFRL